MAKRQVHPGIVALWKTTKAIPVQCPELGWDYPAFQDLTNINADPGCWGDIEPTFCLYTNDQSMKLDTTEIKVDSVSSKDIKHLVVVIHGYNANADPNDNDRTSGLEIWLS